MTSAGGIRPLRGADLRAGLTGALAWLVPIVVIGAVYFSPRHLVSPQTLLTALVGLCIVIVAAQRPDLSLIGLIVFLPFQGLLLAKLWAWGMPASVVSHLGAWKEALAIGIVLAGVRNMMATGRRLDTVDRLALAFVSFALAYAALQSTIVPGAPSASSIRLLGFRETAGFVLLLFGARHAPFGPGYTRRVGRALLVVGTIVSAVGIYEAIFSSAWNHFVVHTIKYTQYQIGVLHSTPFNPGDIRVYGTLGGTRIVRIGSVFVNELICAWYLILPFAIGVERLIRRPMSPAPLIATTMIGAALLLTQTRSAILGGLVVLLLGFQPVAGRGRHWRTQLAIVLGILAVLAVPLASEIGLAKRVAGAGSQNNQSTAGHISGFWSGVRVIEQHPLGLGLGTGAGTGQRFAVQNYVIPENNYLEVLDELGVLPGLIFAALAITVLLALRRVARERADPLTAAVWAGGVGLAVAAWFLQTWSDFSVAWTFWGAAGAVLSVAREPAVALGFASTRMPSATAPVYGPPVQRAASSASR